MEGNSDLTSPVSGVNQCAHYCSIGGHLWSHDTEIGKTGIRSCMHKIKDTEYEIGVTKFFVPCPLHMKLYPMMRIIRNSKAPY